MCEYCEKGKKIEEAENDNIYFAIFGRFLRVHGRVLSIPLGRDVIIEYCPMCRKEVGRVTIREYIFKNNISYRQLAKQLGISHTYLYDLSKSRRKTISEEVANRFKAIAPEIDMTVETKQYYRIR